MSTTEGKFYETLHKYQSDFVKHKTHEGRRKCAAGFRVYIDSESRTKGIEEFTTFLQEINRTLVQLIGSANVPEKLCGIYLLDELIEVPYEENEIKITRFAQYLRMIYDSNDSFNLYLYQCAINVFGHLVRVGGVLVADLILGEARKSLEFLRGDKPDKNVTALLILKTLAENAPTLFSPYLDSCIDSLWPTLHSNNENVRNCALDCLHQCILLVNTRLPAQRDQLYTRINTEILGLFKLNTADAIQGGLRAIALLLIYGGDFLLPYFNKVLELVFQHKEHRDRAVRDTVVMLIPTLIAYSPTSFQAGTQLPSLISHVIAILHKAQHESSISIAYISLGKIALHTGQALLYKLDVIANLVKDGLKKKTRTTHSSVLQCLSMLSRALGLALLPYATDLVDLLFEGGLSPPLVNTLAELAQNLPVLLPSIQSRLLSAISLILSQVDINNTTITKSAVSFLSRAGILMSGGSSSNNIGPSSPNDSNVASNIFLGGGPPGLLNQDEDFDPNSPTGLISLALSTLGQFDFTSHNLLPFVYQRVLPWLNASDAKLRSQTAKCCLNIVLRPPSNPLNLHLTHYLQMQDVIFAIQDQVQLQQKLLIVIAGDGTLSQNKGDQEDDDFDPEMFTQPKQWQDIESAAASAHPTTGRRTRTGSVSITNSKLLTMDIRNSTVNAIKPINATPQTAQLAPLALRPIPSLPKSGSLLPRSPTEESPRSTSSTTNSQNKATTSTPKALLGVARKLKYKHLRDPMTPRPSLSLTPIQNKERLMGQLYGPGSAAAAAGFGTQVPNHTPNQGSKSLGTNLDKRHSTLGMGGGQAMGNSSSYGVDLFNNLLKVQFQVLTQLHVQMELFLSLQRQNFNNSNAFGTHGSGLALSEGLGLGKYTGTTGTTLAQTLSQDAHQLLAQIQVALLQVQQEQQLVLQAQATGIDMSGLATSAIFDHLKRHKRRSKRTSAIQSLSPLQQFGPLGGKPISPPVNNSNDLKHEMDSQLLIRAYISSGMAQELGIQDLANFHNQGHVTAVRYSNNIAHCVLQDPTLAAVNASINTGNQASASHLQGSPDKPNDPLNQSKFSTQSSSGPTGTVDDYGAVGGVQNLPKGWTIMVNEVLTRLVAVTLSDPDPSIRHNVLSLLTPHFDVYLSQPHHLSTLVNVLKDPELENKNTALTILCRLMPLNPILVLPILRHFITDVAYQLQLSGSPKSREDSAAILTHIATHAHTFIKPYAIPLLKVLVRVLIGVQSPSVASGILTAIGEMSLVAGIDAYPILAPVLPLLFAIIYNKESHSIQAKAAAQQSLPAGSTPAPSAPAQAKSITAPATATTARAQNMSPVLNLLQGHSTVIGVSHYVALRCLRLICTASGLVMGPYHLFPGLLSTLIRIVCSTLSTQARNEAVQLIGTIGAVDPFVAKLLGSRTQQLTLSDMLGSLLDSVRELFTTSSMSIALSNSPTVSSNAQVQGTNANDTSGDASGTNASASNFLKAITSMLRGAEVEQSTIDDEVLHLFTYTKTIEMESLLQQIRLQAHTWVGWDNENDGTARTTQIAQDHRQHSQQQFLTFTKSSTLLNPYPGNALVARATTVTEKHYDELYHLLDNLAMNSSAGPNVNSDNMYRAYVMYEQQLAANATDLDIDGDSGFTKSRMTGTFLGENDYETGNSFSRPQDLTPMPSPALADATRRGQIQDQQAQPLHDDIYADLYDLSALTISRHKDSRQKKDPTNAMVQMLTTSMSQANPSGAAPSSSVPVVNNNILQLIKLPQPASEIAPELDIAGTDYYRLTAVHALVDILTDAAQSQSHKKAVIALMFIFKTMGVECYKLLPHIVPVFVQTLNYPNDDLRRIILEQLGSMALLTTKHFKAYISPILHLILLNWTIVSTGALPQSVFLLIQRMSSVDINEIQIHMPELLPRLLSLLLSDKSPNRSLSQDVLRALQSLVHCLEPYLHMILPALTQVWAIGSDSPLFVRCLSLHTTAQLLRSVQSLQHVPRLVLPLLELIQSSQHITSSATTASVKAPPVIITANGTHMGAKPTDPKPDLMSEVLQTLCVLVYLMGPRYSKHILSTQSLLSAKNIQHQVLQHLFTKILAQIQLTPLDLPPPLPLWRNDNVDTMRDNYAAVSNPFAIYDDVWVAELGLNRSQFIASNTASLSKPVPKSIPSGSKSSTTEVTTFDKLPVNQANLIKAWDTSQRLTSDDWTEWMKGVCVGMLKDSPFPPLRACSVLAQKDHQLARNLFTVGFASCWNELNDVYQDAIVNALDQALKSPTTPSDILSALLALCEFMEHDDRPLPLDIRQLAHLSATKCHSFAKALHYKEQEFYASSNPSLLLEDLISTHNKLQQPQAAIGILKMATSLPEFRGSLQENWYEQLHRWDEALAAYERKQLQEGLLEKEGSPITQDLRPDQLSALQLQQVNARSRFGNNGSVLGSIVGQASAFSLASSMAGAEASQPTTVSNPFGTVGNIRSLQPASSDHNFVGASTLRLGGTVNIETILGRLRCLKALGDYDRVAKISIDLWNQLQHIALNLQREVQTWQQNSMFRLNGGQVDGRDSQIAGRATMSDRSMTLSSNINSMGLLDNASVPQHLSFELSILPDLMSEVASLACEALHMLGKWDDLPPFFNALSPQVLDRSFYSAIYHIHTGNLPEAEAHLRNAKKLVQDDIYALLGEGYNRAYSSIVGIQLLTELEEAVMYKRLGGHLSETTTSSPISSYISHAQSHTHALSLSRMKPMQDTNNAMSYLHNVNPFMQSNLSHQLCTQLQTPYSVSFDLMSNYAVNNHAIINQVVNDHNHALKLQLQRQKTQPNGAPRLPPRPSTSAAVGSSMPYIMTPQQHQQAIVDQVSETRLLRNAMYAYFQRFGSFADKKALSGRVRPIAPTNFAITNNNDYTSKPSVTCAAHLTNATSSWSELLSRTQHRALIRTAWNQRLKSVQRNPYVWRHLLATRSLVLTPQQNTKFWIQYTHMTSNMGRFDHSLDILKKLLHRNPHQAPLDYELHLNYIQSDPFLSPTRIESSFANRYIKSPEADLPSLTLNPPRTPSSGASSNVVSTLHRPRQLMYLPTANTFLQAISVTKPVDAYTQMMCDIFSLKTGSQEITFSSQQQSNNTVPESIYQFSFGVSSPFDNMFELLDLSTSIKSAAGGPVSSPQIRQHFYQPDFFGFNLDSTQHPLLAVGAIAISPVTLAHAHHVHTASNPLTAKRAQDNSATGSQSSRLGPMMTPTASKSPPTPLAGPTSTSEETETNKAKFHTSYMAYPCAIDDFLVSLAYCQHLWRVGYRNVALDRLTYLTHVLEYLLELTPHTHTPIHHNVHDYLHHIGSAPESTPASKSVSLLGAETKSAPNPEEYHVHLPGDVVYIKHHRFCPHHPLYHTLSQEEITLEHKAQHDREQEAVTKGYLGKAYIPLVCMLSVCPPPQRRSSDDEAHLDLPATPTSTTSQLFQPTPSSANAPQSSSSNVPTNTNLLVPSLTTSPSNTSGSPALSASGKRDSKLDDVDNQWYPLAPIRPTQRAQLTILASKLNRITGDWGLSILSSISPTFGIHFDGVSDTSSSSKTHTSSRLTNSSATQQTLELDLSSLPRVSRNIAETFALSTTLEAYQRSTLYSPQRYRGWHGWAVIHYRAAQIIRVTKQNVSSTLKLAQKQFMLAVNPSSTNSKIGQSLLESSASEAQVKKWSQNIHQLLYDYDSLNKHLHLHVVAAITGFLHSVSLARDTSQSLQDLLRLLALWFSHGNITGRKLYLPAPNAALTSTMAVSPVPGVISKGVKGSKSLRQQYQDVVGLPPIVMGQNKLPSVADVLRQGFNSLPITTWVVVSPQIIARLHSSSAKGTIRVLIQELLLMIGQYHPQALVYPLTVAVKSEQPSLRQTVKQHVLSVALHRGLTIYGPSKRGSATALRLDPTLFAPGSGVRGNIGMVHSPNSTPAPSAIAPITETSPAVDDVDEINPPKKHTHNTALQVMSSLRSISPLLIEQAMVVSRELIRAAVLWHEIWHEALEEASRLWFTQQDPISMLALLLPLHQQIGLGTQSMVQIATAPQNYHIPTGNVISNLVTTLPAFQINSKTAFTAGANNFGANIHQNFFSGPETPREIAFIHIFGRELSLAHDWCMKYLSHMAEEELNIDSTQMWYDGAVISKLKRDLEGYRPGVQFYHPPRHGIQAMNDFLTQQHELHQQAFFGRTADIFSEPEPEATLPSPSISPAQSNTTTVSRSNLEKTASLPFASDLNQAWSIYCTVFRQINKMISQGGEASQFFELHDVSPILLSCQDLVLAIPGTYDPKHHVSTICISRVISHFKIIESKQRPRKLSIIGSDGEEHPFLLKGHEDLRQDTRVMQLFDLVNALLSSSSSSSSTANVTGGANSDGGSSNSNSSSAGGAGSGSGGAGGNVGLAAQGSIGSGSGGESKDLDLNLRGYSVTPLSPVSGVIQWLSNCDTLHALIKNYRDARYVLISAENKLMGQVSANCQTAKILQKVEIFEHALSNTNGRDLADVLWLKASTSEQWLERRNNYTRSLAVTSIVGYILGLGDRHPCNLMLERTSAKVIHIDFGDCFEVAQHRDKFPERVPFRLTRILVRALEVSGIEGTFRLTCEYVMQTLRASKESVMAVLEAFIYDPLITWRLLHDGNAANVPGQVATADDDDDEESSGSDLPSAPLLALSAAKQNKSAPKLSPAIQLLVDEVSAAISHTLSEDLNDDNIFNAKALSVIERIESKLNGTDFHGRWNLAIQQRNKRVVKNKIKCLLGFGLDVTVSQDGFNKHLDDTILSSQEQVELLIQLATNSQVLASAYSGWCPYL